MSIPSTSSPRRPGRPSRPLTRERLLAVAREVFSERGYAGARMDEIAHRVGLRKGSLFHHVKSKEALYRETMSEMLNNLADKILAAGEGEASFTQRLDHLGLLMVEYFGQHRNAARLLLREIIDDGPIMSGPDGDAIRSVMDIVVSFLSSGVEQDDEPGTDPRQLALSIVGLHLFPFAAEKLVTGTLGEELFCPAATDRRRQAVLQHVRRLCQLAPEPEDPAGK